jgi:hypothetical protein
MTKVTAEHVDMEFDGKYVWAVIRVGQTVIARERVPRQYIKPDIDPELQEWYMRGVAKRLKAKLKNKPITDDNGQALN